MLAYGRTIASLLAATVAAAGAAACGGSDTGIIVSVTADPATVTVPVEQLRFVIGVDDGTGYVLDSSQPEALIDVTDRDLTITAYRLLLHDGGTSGTPTRVIVGVIGLAGGAPVGFGGWDVPQSFMPGKIVERTIELVGMAPFRVTAAGCLFYGDVSIALPDDRDCDGDPTTNDCNDLDPTVGPSQPEVCDNGVDDDCDPATPDMCAACLVPADCDAQLGPPPCGTWKCAAGTCTLDCPGCSDGDGDGYGISTVPGACAGLDCDDDDPTITDSAVRSCYGGDSGSIGVGVCRAGTETCTAGIFGPCSGDVTPSGEACNLEDDDCDGQADEDLGTFGCGLGACAATVPACTGGVVGTCTPGGPVAVNDASCNGVDDDCDGPIDEDCVACVHVSPTGNDMLAPGSGNVTPFQTIQAAINWAAGDATLPQIICVAAGPACGTTGTYPAPVVMASGVSVYGGYESTTWTHCGNSTTVIATGGAVGVLFDSSIDSPDVTVLDHFRVDRAVPAGAAQTAAVTIDGATGVILSRLVINNLPAVPTSYGVDMINGADAIITSSAIFAGNGSVRSVGVRALNSRPTIRANCHMLDAAGRCDDWCTSGVGTPNAGIRGRASPGSGESYAVLLESAGAALVESSALCGNDAEIGAALKVVGDATGMQVRGSLVTGWGGAQHSHGAWFEDCSGAAPWIVDNYQFITQGDNDTTQSDAIRSIGDCHPVIDSNLTIMGSGEGSTSGTNAVHCGANTAGIASRCVVLGNPAIFGSAFGYPPTSVGVRCDDDACLRIADNVISGQSGVDVWGVWLAQGGPVVERNRITGGCGGATATGVRAEDSWARLENNVISAGSCNGSTSAGSFIGLDVIAAAGGNEIDVHSNVIDAAGNAAGACTGMALRVSIRGPGPLPGKGVYRNNILRGGDCATTFTVVESDPMADPRIFENQDLDPYGAPAALYVNEGIASLMTAADVNALTDITVGGTISVDPLFQAYPLDVHLTAGSMCIGAGTPAGAPLADYEGDPRDAAAPDIGPDEF